MIGRVCGIAALGFACTLARGWFVTRRQPASHRRLRCRGLPLGGIEPRSLEPVSGCGWCNTRGGVRRSGWAVDRV